MYCAFLEILEKKHFSSGVILASVYQSKTFHIRMGSGIHKLCWNSNCEE